MAQDNTPKYWDNRIGNYNIDQLFNIVEQEPMTKYMLRYFPKNSKILDAGCGDGKFAFYLIKQGYNVQGIDFSEKKIEQAKRYAKQLGLKENLFDVGDVVKTKFEDESFDAYLARGVFHHLNKKEQRRMLREAYRLLKKNGIIFISIIKLLSMYTLLREFFERTPRKQNLVKVHYMTKSELKKIVELYGFKYIKIFDDKPFWKVGFISSIFIGKKVKL